MQNALKLNWREYWLYGAEPTRVVKLDVKHMRTTNKTDVKKTVNYVGRLNDLNKNQYIGAPQTRVFTKVQNKSG